jgi:AcrR family transcriptional regulator
MVLPSPPWVTGRKRARRKLSLEAVVAAGLELLAAEGLDAVTMRAVAAKLDTGAASLYAHVRDKSELHQWMLDAVLGEVEIPEADPDRWQEQLKQACRSIYAAMARHQGIAAVNMAHIPLGPNALRSSEALLKILLAGGLTREVAGLAVDLMTLYPTAVAFEESVWRERAAKHPDDEDWKEESLGIRIEEYFRALPDEEFPLTKAMAPFLTAGDGQLRFEFGLGVLVAGLAALKDWKPTEIGGS